MFKLYLCVYTLHTVSFGTEPISMVTIPMHQNVNSSDSASFNCSAPGSSIEIIWQYNGETYTMANSNLNIEVKNIISASIVSSALMIRSVTVSGSVSCVVHQRFDGSTDPNFNNAHFMNALPDNDVHGNFSFIDQ